MTNNSNRWKFLFTACLVNFCTGSIYAWSVFAGPKAEQMSQLNNVRLGQRGRTAAYDLWRLYQRPLWAGLADDDRRTLDRKRSVFSRKRFGLGVFNPELFAAVRFRSRPDLRRHN